LVLGDQETLHPKEADSRAHRYVLRALDIDNTLGEGHAVLGALKLQYDWDWVGAEHEFKRGLELNPNYAQGHHWYALYLEAVGKLAEAKSQMEEAQQLDQLSPITQTARHTMKMHTAPTSP
jgi:tetratricopeptide (TPR) repeat protein